MDPERLGVDFATGIGGLWTLLDAWDTLREKGPRRVLPTTVPMLMPNAAAGIAISMNLNARAFARTVASACASSTESIVNAYEHLQLGLADVIVAGGTEAAIHPITHRVVQLRCRRSRAATTTPRPPRGRTTSLGTASSWAKALHASCSRRRSTRSPAARKIYAELAGGGVTSDAYHMTAPDPEGLGATRAMRMALDWTNAKPEEVTHINAHATSTPVGDIAEFHGAEGRVRGSPGRDPGVGDQGIHRAPARRYRRAGGAVHHPRDAATAWRRRPST